MGLFDAGAYGAVMANTYNESALPRSGPRLVEYWKSHEEHHRNILKGTFHHFAVVISIYAFVWFVSGVESLAREAITVVWPRAGICPGWAWLFAFS